MYKNVDQGSAVEYTAALPPLTKSPEEKEKSLYVFFCVCASISIGREIRCLPYAGFLNKLSGGEGGSFLSNVQFYNYTHLGLLACQRFCTSLNVSQSP